MVVKHGLSEEQMKDDFKQGRCNFYGMLQVLFYGTRGDEIRSKLEMRQLDRQLQEEKLVETSTEDAIR
jgi:hypothetical protein